MEEQWASKDTPGRGQAAAIDDVSRLFIASIALLMKKECLKENDAENTASYELFNKIVLSLKDASAEHTCSTIEFIFAILKKANNANLSMKVIVQIMRFMPNFVLTEDHRRVLCVL